VSFERKSFAYVKMIRKKDEDRGMDTGDFTLLQVEEAFWPMKSADDDAMK